MLKVSSLDYNLKSKKFHNLYDNENSTSCPRMPSTPRLIYYLLSITLHLRLAKTYWDSKCCGPTINPALVKYVLGRRRQPSHVRGYA